MEFIFLLLTIIFPPAFVLFTQRLRRTVLRKYPLHVKTKIKGIFYMYPIYNRGGFGGILSGSFFFLLFFRIACLLLFSWLSLIYSEVTTLSYLGFLLIFSGACSNLYEYIKYKKVSDYLFFRFKFRRLLVYNVADFLIFIGAIVYILGQV